VTEDQLAFLDAYALAGLLHSKQLSPVEVTQMMLSRIERVDKTFLSYATITYETALAQARLAEAMIMRRQILSPLHGVPIALKDLCFTQGIVTAAGMPMMRDFVPVYDGTVVKRLREAGTVLLGKLTMTEAAFADHHPDVPPPINPWHRDHWSGASSSGSGVAVAAGLCFAAIGTDTGGSIRFPSAANGVTGLKPTWARVPVYGAFELAASLDHIGPMARTAIDCGHMLGLIAGADTQDRVALHAPVPDYVCGDNTQLSGLRIGFDEEYCSGLDEDMQKAMQSAFKVFQSLGADMRYVRFPDVSDAVSDWGTACAVETAVAHEPWHPKNVQSYGPGLTSLIEFGRSISASEMQKIWVRRRRFSGEVRGYFQNYDLLLIPAQPMASPTCKQMLTIGTVPAELARLIKFTAPFDMSGSPTITLPAGFTSKNTPVAIQLVAGHMAEATLVRAGSAFQQVTDWHSRTPPSF
jgi:amidase|tara:strand:- start:1022 stop:2422 length:1401 start_codon:yes stop_codon:yes gene_type:complete